MKDDEIQVVGQESADSAEFLDNVAEMTPLSMENDTHVREAREADELGKASKTEQKAPEKDRTQSEAEKQLQANGGGSESAGGSGGGASGAGGGASAAGSAAGAVGGVAAAVAVVAASSIGLAGFSDLGLPGSTEPISAHVEFADIGENYAQLQISFSDANADDDVFYVVVDGEYANKTYEMTESGKLTIEGLKSASEYVVNVGMRDENGTWISLVENATFTTKLCTQSTFDYRKGVQYSYDFQSSLFTFSIRNCISDDTGMFSAFSAVITDELGEEIRMTFAGKPTDTQNLSLEGLKISSAMKLTVYFTATDDTGAHEIFVEFPLTQMDAQ